MPRPLQLFLACLCGMFLQTLSAVEAAEGEVLAWVGSVSITADRLVEAGARKTPAEGDHLSSAEKLEVLDNLIDEELLYARALARGLDKDPKVKKVMVNTLLREDVYANVKNADFSDSMLKAYFDAHREEFVVPEKVQILRILLKPEGHTDAEAQSTLRAVVARLRAGTSRFNDEAAAISEDPYKRRGGDVGFVSMEGKPGLEQAVVTRAFSMGDGQISDPFRTDEGWNVIQVAARREQVERTFEEMKGSTLRKVKNDRMKELYDGYVSDLRAGAKIRIDRAAVERVNVVTSKSFSTEDETPEE